jgi:hypothetical protein
MVVTDNGLAAKGWVAGKPQERGRLWLHDGSCVRLRPPHPNHVWSSDSVADRTYDGRAIKILTVIDEYSLWRSWWPGRSHPMMCFTVSRIFLSTMGPRSTSAQTMGLNLLLRRSGAGWGGSGSRPCSSSREALGRVDTMNLSMETSDGLTIPCFISTSSIRLDTSDTAQRPHTKLCPLITEFPCCTRTDQACA